MKTEIKNLKKAAKRILKAVKSKEKIIIYGDADLDGTASVIIVKEAVMSLAGQITAVYFPDREKEGYGITEIGLDYLKQHSPALLIALDCGISNFKETETANKLGFEVIIIDHHLVLDKLPKASIIVDPKQKGDKYPFKELANVGLAFKLSELILKKRMTENLRKSFLELTAIATIADMMPKVDENEKMIVEGLNSIEQSWRPGLQALFGLKEIKPLGLMQKIFKINSLLNVRDVEEMMPASFRLLTAFDKSKAEELAEKLFIKGADKRKKANEIIEEAEKRIFGKPFPVIFEGDSGWDLALLGTAASILVKKHKKPVFLFKIQEEESQTGARAPSEFNLVEAMKSCSEKLLTYGGHPKAAGCRFKNKDREEVKKCLINYFEKYEK